MPYYVTYSCYLFDKKVSDKLLYWLEDFVKNTAFTLGTGKGFIMNLVTMHTKNTYKDPDRTT